MPALSASPPGRRRGPWWRCRHRARPCPSGPRHGSCRAPDRPCRAPRSAPRRRRRRLARPCGLGQRPELLDQRLQVFRMARGEHHRVAGLDPQAPDRPADIAAADHRDRIFFDSWAKAGVTVEARASAPASRIVRRSQAIDELLHLAALAGVRQAAAGGAEIVLDVAHLRRPGTGQVTASCDRTYLRKNCGQLLQSNSAAKAGNSRPRTRLNSRSRPNGTLTITAVPRSRASGRMRSAAFLASDRVVDLDHVELLGLHQGFEVAVLGLGPGGGAPR